MENQWRKSMNRLVEEIMASNANMAFWWLGQLGYVVKITGVTVYIDVFFSDYPGRRLSPLIAAAEVVNADIVMGTHDHADHIDRKAWKEIAKASPQAVFVAPNKLIKALSHELDIPLERFTGVDDGETVNIKGLSITGIAAAHEFLDRDPETGSYPYMGYSVSDGKRRFFHSGDCCIYDGLADKIERCGKPDIMFLPINGRDAKRYLSGCIGNMTFQEAVDLAGRIRPGLAVPGHYDMFAHNAGNPDEFVDYLNAKYPGIKSWVGQHGKGVTK